MPSHGFLYKRSKNERGRRSNIYFKMRTMRSFLSLQNNFLITLWGRCAEVDSIVAHCTACYPCSALPTPIELSPYNGHQATRHKSVFPHHLIPVEALIENPRETVTRPGSKPGRPTH